MDPVPIPRGPAAPRCREAGGCERASACPWTPGHPLSTGLHALALFLFFLLAGVTGTRGCERTGRAHGVRSLGVSKGLGTGQCPRSSVGGGPRVPQGSSREGGRGRSEPGNTGAMGPRPRVWGAPRGWAVQGEPPPGGASPAPSSALAPSLMVEPRPAGTAGPVHVARRHAAHSQLPSSSG